MLLADAPRFLTTDKLQYLLRDYIYRDGWELTIFQDPWEGPCLYVVADVPDAYNPGEIVELRIRSNIPPIPSESYFEIWLAWRLGLIASHETREMFRRRDTGRPVYDPHDHAEPGGKLHRKDSHDVTS